MEINNLEFAGLGQIVDPQAHAGNTGNIGFKANMDLVQIVMTLDHETRDGNLVPKLSVDDVAF